MSKIARTFRADFLSDGTDRVSFDISAPPLNIKGTEGCWLLNTNFRAESNVLGVPDMLDCKYEGTTITAVFAHRLPEKDVNGFMARYALGFTLIYE